MIDAVAGELAWPWTGRSTPIWEVALAAAGLAAPRPSGVLDTVSGR